VLHALTLIFDGWMLILVISRRFSQIALLVVMLAPVMAGCGDADAEQVPQSGTLPTATVAESLEGHATETDDQPGQADAGSIDLAPDLESADAWYNTEPLTLEELRGHPVLLVFWATY
jgi:hypothetical protein